MRETVQYVMLRLDLAWMQRCCAACCSCCCSSLPTAAALGDCMVKMLFLCCSLHCVGTISRQCMCCVACALAACCEIITSCYPFKPLSVWWYATKA
ncbi:hypothetical protein COO60DRAFT_1472751 [Scenedesmus sp. NREL 46B-D3]|nr:hypothetical protein COO60DRAFT_1472751 [Scenedesmus sp. NREL 46B-D3]